MVGDAILTSCHVLNRVPTNNKEITPFEEWKKERLTLLSYELGVVCQKSTRQSIGIISLDQKPWIVFFWAMLFIASSIDF